jgi:hypothetical protein
VPLWLRLLSAMLEPLPESLVLEPSLSLRWCWALLWRSHQLESTERERQLW